jgi:peptidoglycan/xylan/chitin deacetylase (PgdA/CDA1 family)
MIRRRSVRELGFVVASVMLAVACSTGADDFGQNVEALSTCPNDPGFGTDSCSQSAWWIEYSVTDTTVTSIKVEVQNTTRVVNLTDSIVLGDGHLKFSGSPDDGPVKKGTMIRLTSTSASHGTMTSNWFGYMSAKPSLTCGDAGADSGTSIDSSVDAAKNDATVDGGTDATVDATVDAPAESGTTDGGSADTGTVDAGSTDAGVTTGFNPYWSQTQYNGEWWTEYVVQGGGSLPVSVGIEVNGTTYPLGYCCGKWTGGPGYIPKGTTVILHAKDATGATAQTVPFKYLVDTSPSTDTTKITPSTSTTCQPLARGMLSLTMDDSYPSQWTLAAPVMAKYGMKATIYNITHTLIDYGWLPSAQSLAGAGHEVGSHTVNHNDMTAMSVTDMDSELANSQSYLLANVGNPVDSFATPMGSYNATVLTEIKKYYTSHRTVNPGLNYMGSSVYELNSDGAYGGIAPSDICTWLQDTAKYRGWRILMFHDFTTAATSNNDLLYPVADFESILKCAQQTPNLDVVTVHDGANAIRCASP